MTRGRYGLFIPRGAMAAEDVRLVVEARERPAPCGICGGRTELLGVRPPLRWSRCRVCGSEQRERDEPEEEATP